MYTSFAEIYDSFMDNVPYDFWTEQTVRILKNHDIHDGIICELGCGTGCFTERLASLGYDMIGIDNSEDMLDVALDKKIESGRDILYLCQDMREFELYGTCRAIISRCDSINYITDFDELVQVFKLVNNYLDPKGLFIFDVKTEHMYRDILGTGTFARNNDDGSYIWQNAYYPDERINEYELTVFVREDEEEEIFRRDTELHVQRAYTIDELKYAAQLAGLEWISIVDGNTDGEIDDESERYLIVLGEKGK